MLDSLLTRASNRALETINRLIPWHRLPTWLGLANLVELREQLRAENLYDTSHLDRGDGHHHGEPALEPPTSDVLRARSADGSYNDLENPRMGMAQTRFGRNIPLGAVRLASPRVLTAPSPRTVSQALLARREFVPARSLNVLAAAWIQFMTRDWFSHGETDELGWSIVRDPVHVNDFHATLLHLFGLDHLRLTHRYQGRDFRLTDVAGEVKRDWLA